MSIFIAIAALGLLILIHELGHFLVARWLGVAVTNLSIGFGPKLFTREHNGTAYSISLIPIGGYVKMLDEEIEEGETPKGKPIGSVSPYARIAISIAGPCTNLLFTLFAYICVTLTGIPHQSTLIGSTFLNTPAAAASIQAGDRVLSVSGKITPYWEDMLGAFAETNGAEVPLVISRKGEEIVTSVAAANSNGRWMIGVKAAGEIVKEHISVTDALPKAFSMTVSDVKSSAFSFTHMFGNFKQIGGPIMIAQIGAERSRMGVASMLMFMAFLSANLFVLNLLPLPVLDGGAIVFNLWEAIFGKPIPDKLQRFIVATGSAFVLVLIVAIVLGDVVKMFH